VKSANTIMILLLIVILIDFLKLDVPITYTIPFLGGMPPSKWDVAGCAVILTTLWGLHYLGRNHHHHE